VERRPNNSRNRDRQASDWHDGVMSLILVKRCNLLTLYLGLFIADKTVGKCTVSSPHLGDHVSLPVKTNGFRFEARCDS